MHDSAFEIGSRFLSTYAGKKECVILDIGALDVNGSLRKACPANATFLGIDYEQGEGVDIVVRPGQALPLESEFADLILSSSQMEHDMEFWTSLNEMFRVLKPGGVIYINTPSNGNYHPYPNDAWRFYPDAGRAFAALGRKNNYPMTLLESFTARRMTDQWNDFVCVLFKGEWPEGQAVTYLSDVFDSHNVWRFQAKEMARIKVLTEDQSIMDDLRNEVVMQQQIIKKLSKKVVKLRTKLERRPIRGIENRMARAWMRLTMASRHLSAVAIDRLKSWSKAWRPPGVFNPGGID